MITQSKYLLFLLMFALSFFPSAAQTVAPVEVALRLSPSADNPRNSEGDFIRLNDGRIVFIYTRFYGGAHDHAQALLASRISNDQGKTWSRQDQIVLANEGDMNIMSVSLLRLQSGEIALFYLRKNSNADCIPYMRISDDETQTWGEAVRCVATKGYHVLNNSRVVQLENGRILLPVALHKSNARGIEAGAAISCYYSDDNGKSWQQSKTVPNPQNIILQEPGVVELKNGEILLYCRTNEGFQYFSSSTDSGLNWLPVEEGNIRSPLSPASIKRIPATGDLLAVWNNNTQHGENGGKRTPLNIAFSANEGKTWSKVKTIENDPDGWYCYTAIDFLDDYVLLAYCAGNRKENNGLETTQITRLSIDCIYK